MNPSPLPEVVIVGLGPGGTDHVTTETLAAIEREPHRYVRTSIHPTAALVPGATSFDEIYDRADTFDDVYREIVERLVAAAEERRRILYAVPGSPVVLERTVRALIEDRRVTTDVLPAMSFLDVAYARLGIDPVSEGLRLIDAHDFATAAAGERGPLLVAHVHADWLLSDIKLAVDDLDGDTDDAEVVVLQGLGTDDERISHTRWADLDREVAPDHLTTLYVPRLAAPVGAEYVRFHHLARTLREQCPWDVEQTHQSLVPYLIEETYEVVDALQALDPNDPATDADLVEELGDLLYQVEFHATIAEQEGRFSIADVARGIHDKLVRRHPHVFGDVEVGDGRAATDTVLANWDEIKRTEKGRTSVFDGVAHALPALSYAAKLQHRAAKVGFDWPDVSGPLGKVDEEVAELAAELDVADDPDPDRVAAELGDVLIAVVNVARHLHVDPEAALRAAAVRFRRRFEVVERLAGERGIDLRTAGLVVLDGLWDEAKAAEVG